MKRVLLDLLGALAVFTALNLQLTTAHAQGTAFTLLTITNPTPAAGDEFGYSVAAVGTDRLLIGAASDYPSALDAGEAYLFSTNGTLLTTFANPTPAAHDYFSISVAAVGTDRVLIGASGDDTGATDAGAAYLFSTNGALLTIFTNPPPAASDRFGCSVAAVGTDRVLIGAIYGDRGGTDAGAAYLFGTNGMLLTTFTNPTPAYHEYFGHSVAAVGADRVLIGAYGDNTGASWAGAAYLFNTNGALLTTFTSSTPAANDWFGISVAAVGTDRVLIGALYDDTGGFEAGAAYLFSTNGALLTTFTNPAPTASEWFGRSVAAVGTGRVLIGAPLDNTGAYYAGAAYLFTATVPSLNIHLMPTNTVAVSWTSPLTHWTLQEIPNGVASVNWSNAPGPIQEDGATQTLLIAPPTGNQFYRLIKP